MSAGAKKSLPIVSRPLEEHEISPEKRLMRRLATNAVREACEVRRGRLTPRALLAYQWLSQMASPKDRWTPPWICQELDWNYDDWRKKSLEYVRKSWKRLAWNTFTEDLEQRSRQVRALASGAADDWLPLVELAYWHEIADVDLPDVQRPRMHQELLQFGAEAVAPQDGEHDAPQTDEPAGDASPLDAECAPDAGDDADRDAQQS